MVGVGILPTDISGVQVGAPRASVEKILGPPEDPSSEHPDEAAYKYDLGMPPRPGTAVMGWAIEFFTMGAAAIDSPEGLYYLYSCQRAILKITYENNV
jgi:hypothetical protein